MRLKLYRGVWAVVWHDGKQSHRRSLGTPDRATAERRFKDVKVEVANDTVADAVALYLREKMTVARSHEAMQACWKATKPMFGHLRPDQIDPALCRQYAAKRRSAGRKNGTIIKDLSFLRTALKWAKRTGAEFELPEAPVPKARYLTKPEYERLLAACVSPHVRLFVTLALSTGGRASAILELTWDRVDFDAGRIQLSKGEERRKGRATVRMSARARAALEVAKEAATGDHVIEYAGLPVRSVKHAFRDAVKKAKLKNVTPHVLRHTAAVWAIEAGASMDEVAQFLGHTDPRLTYRVYARFSTNYQKRITDALE